MNVIKGTFYLFYAFCCGFYTLTQQQSVLKLENQLSIHSM